MGLSYSDIPGGNLMGGGQSIDGLSLGGPPPSAPGMVGGVGTAAGGTRGGLRASAVVGAVMETISVRAPLRLVEMNGADVDSEPILVAEGCEWVDALAEW